MPAQREELAEALEEGIALVDGAMLTSVAAVAGAGLTLACVRVSFTPAAVRGRFSVSPFAGSEFTLAADALIPAIGQDADLAPFSTWLPIEGNLLATDAQQATHAERVWAGGDVASLARFVTEAIGMGKRAALAIDRRLRGVAAGPVEERAAAVGLDRIATFYHPPRERVADARRPAAERVASGLEVQLGLELEQVLDEAGRCFSCGTCTHCDNCFQHCPDLAIRRMSPGEGGGYVVLTDYCKGCGICVKECPSGSMTMREELR
jgi:Pyruvate/2-oxoacid:ferredoxin oxidoreductase delta subunit